MGGRGAVARFDFDLRRALGIVILEMDLQGSAVLDDEVASVCWMEVVVVVGHLWSIIDIWCKLS